MTDIEEKALALVNEVERSSWEYYEIERIPNFSTICRAIEQHEAFRREVSDAIDSSILTPETEAHLGRFIIAKPDPLVEALGSAPYLSSAKETAEHIRAALAARGFKIVEVE